MYPTRLALATLIALSLVTPLGGAPLRNSITTSQAVPRTMSAEPPRSASD